MRDIRVADHGGAGDGHRLLLLVVGVSESDPLDDAATLGDCSGRCFEVEVEDELVGSVLIERVDLEASLNLLLDRTCEVCLQVRGRHGLFLVGQKLPVLHTCILGLHERGKGSFRLRHRVLVFLGGLHAGCSALGRLGVVHDGSELLYLEFGSDDGVSDLGRKLGNGSAVLSALASDRLDELVKLWVVVASIAFSVGQGTSVTRRQARSSSRLVEGKVFAVLSHVS
mmetsp:Transcript_19707/g.24300  ORF Transcript_19707/g.24300 Transcript_19707/m.24300 type:complete len:226 (+) Transcript_19707:936-1613(+)